MSNSREEYFDQIGSGWDELREGFFTDATREKAIGCAEVRAGTLAADVGAGTGYITEALAARGVGVIAVDSSESMLTALTAKLQPEADVDCRQGDAEALPIEDGTVDYTFANMLLHHVESPPAAIREMARILKPGGTLVLTDLDEHDFEFLVTEHHDRWKGFERDRIREWFVEAGLVDVRVDCAGADCCAVSGTGEGATVGIFVAWAHRPSG
ncbi:MAG: class I SAM-dependent methyltransferase [bacterium]|nr:class I SAM-dependent methyltransferase [bacterium]